jgi:hypothetical protein
MKMKNQKLFLCLKKWRYALASIFLIIVIVSMFIYSVAGNLWLKYPLFLKTPLAFQKLSLSVFAEPLCHEDCSLKRLLARGVLVESLKSGNQKIKEKIIKTLSAADEDLVFKQELLKVWREAFGAEDVSADLLAVFEASADVQLRSFLQNNFKIPLSSWRDVERSKVGDQKIALSERAQSLILLASKDPEFKQWSEKEKILAVEELRTSYLQALLISQNNELPKNFFADLWPLLFSASEKERNSAIFLARAKLEQGNQEAEDFLIKIYQNSEFSPFSRSFAAEILNRQQGKENFSLPKISEQDWEKYLSRENL